ncbi:MAG: DUF4197 domain-containing protein [Gammaproteobacteria bacterium]
MKPRPGMLALSAVLLVFTGAALAGALDSLTNKDASSGLRTALSQGIDVAVAQLGKPNGFLLDPKVMIPLPPKLQKADKALRLMGMGTQADELKTAMNHAAENAVAEATPVFKDALAKMTVADAKAVLTGGDDAGTQYFRKATSAQLTAKFKPIVARATSNAQLASLYDQYAGRAANLGLLKAEDANLNDYVTAKALDGLFSRIAEQEHAIRQDPLGQTSSLLRKVFGAVK